MSGPESSKFEDGYTITQNCHVDRHYFQSDGLWYNYWCCDTSLLTDLFSDAVSFSEWKTTIFRIVMSE